MLYDGARRFLFQASAALGGAVSLAEADEIVQAIAAAASAQPAAPAPAPATRQPATPLTTAIPPLHLHA